MNLGEDSVIPKAIQDELSIIIPKGELNSIGILNTGQSLTFNTIMGSIERNDRAIFFVDGPGGTGKTYMYRAILAAIRSQGRIAIATATLGITATLMPGGRTTHSRFKIPINPDPSFVCSISKQSGLAELIRRVTIILWDEATMANPYALEAVDHTFQDIIDVESAFGGKIMVLGGDFRQVLPVIPNDTEAETISASIVKSPLWRNVHVLRLKEIMRSVTDPYFGDFILRVGDDLQPTVVYNMIRIPTPIAIPCDGEQAIHRLIEETNPNISNHGLDGSYIVCRGLITHRNEDVNKLNERVIQKFSGNSRTYYSFDEIENDVHNLYQPELLNSISPGGFPPHGLNLKVGASIMLLRNIDPSNGLCNDTRLLCRSLNNNFLDAKILTGYFKGTRVFLPRIPLNTLEDIKLPFQMTRKQFPVRLSFTLTINKS